VTVADVTLAATLADLLSLLSQRYPVIALPPLLGGDQEIESWFTTVEETDGADGAAGTVVAVTVAAEEAAEVPALLVAVTVIEYCTLEARPVTVIGEDAPVAVLVV
jgi:hypothetical protein